MTFFGYTLGQVRKSLISVTGFVVAVLTAATTGNLVPQRWLPAALGVVGVATSVGVFLTRNAVVAPAPVKPDPRVEVVNPAALTDPPPLPAPPPAAPAPGPPTLGTLSPGGVFTAPPPFQGTSAPTIKGP